MSRPLRGYRMRHAGGVSWRAEANGSYVCRIEDPTIVFTIRPLNNRGGGKSYDLSIEPENERSRRSGSWPFPGLDRAFAEAGKMARMELHRRNPDAAQEGVDPTPLQSVVTLREAEKALRFAGHTLGRVPVAAVDAERLAIWRNNVESTRFEIEGRIAAIVAQEKP